MTGKNSTNKPLNRFCFTGVRGVGKSTIIEQIKTISNNIHLVSGSDILHDMMGEEYHNFEYLPEKEKYSLRLKLNDILYDLQKANRMDLLVDAHLTVYNLKTGHIDNIFTENDLRFYTDIILLDSIPEKVYHHRKKDTKKQRIVDFETIKQELKVEKKEAHLMAEEYGLRLHIVEMGPNASNEIIRTIQVVQG